jgi:CRP-like cAMP-binding protein
LIESGLVKLLRWETPETEVTVSIRYPGWPLACEAAILGVPCIVTAETLTRCRISSVRSELFLDAVKTDEKVSFDLHRVHAQELAEYITHLGGLGALSTRDRLLRLIGELLRAEGSPPEGGPLRLRLPVSYQELARTVVTTRQHLARVLKELENDQILLRRKGSLVIPNPARFWSAIKQEP